MEDKKFMVYDLQVIDNEKKSITNMEEFDDFRDAFVSMIHSEQVFRIAGGLQTGVIRQLVERKGRGMVFVRATLWLDSRPVKNNLRGDDETAFGFGMSMPKMKRDAAVEIAEQVLYEYEKYLAGKRPKLPSIEGPVVLRWYEWLRKEFIPKNFSDL